MLLLQPRKVLQELPRKTIFLGKLLLISAALHVILFIGLFLYKDTTLQTLIIHGNTIDNLVPVFFLPSIKNGKQPFSVASSAALSHSLKKVTQPASAKIEKKVQKQTKKNQAKQPSKKNVVEKKEIAKKEQAVQDTSHAKLLSNNLETKKKIAQQKSEKKVEPEPKQSIKQEVKEVKPAPAEQKKESYQQPLDATDPMVLNLNQPTHDTAYLGVDMEILYLQQEIQTALNAVWKGFTARPPDSPCSVKVTINNEGKAEHIVQEKLSRSIVHNINVRNYLDQITFPRQMWNKEYILII